MELARLFATVGFKVDTEGLKEFRKELLLVKSRFERCCPEHWRV